MVFDYTFDLLNVLKTGSSSKYSQKIPDWFVNHKDFILSNILEESIISRYTLFHDIGKPLCLEIDQEGRRHFPNHEIVSYNLYRELFPLDCVVSDLIKRDMDLHRIKMDQVESYASNYRDTVITQLIVSLAELNANAVVFGGTNTDSFKIKYKKINKLGSRLVSSLK